MIDDAKSCPHKNHRSRVKAAVAASGFDGMNPHNVMEFLLFYPIPRRDTNELAHAVIDKFGGVGASLAASEGELCEIEGIGESSARFLRLLGELNRRYLRCSSDAEAALDTDEKRGRRALKTLSDTGTALDRPGGSVYLLGAGMSFSCRLDIDAAPVELTSAIIRSRSIAMFSETHGMSRDEAEIVFRRLRRTAFLLGAKYEGCFLVAPDMSSELIKTGEAHE